jgi:hypothetical protein
MIFRVPVHEPSRCAGATRLDVKCSKCGAPNRVTAEVGVEYACKECGHEQKTLCRAGRTLPIVARSFDGRASKFCW